MFLDLLTEEFTDLSHQITDIDLDKELTQPTVDDVNMLGDGSQLPPFPDLRALNLAHNKVYKDIVALFIVMYIFEFRHSNNL